jgi:hypothetical protein
MNTLFLHVGPHKTGTTLIQKFCLDNQAELFKSNLVYPKRYLKIFGHHGFRERLQNQSLGKEDLDFFQENHDFLLSSEDFISLHKNSFEYLRNTIKSKNIVVLFAWRRASFKLFSIWQETVKHGATESFYSYYHNHLARPAQSQMLSADLKLDTLCRVFGKQNVKVLDYDASNSNDSLLADFVGALGLECSESFVMADNNPNAVNRSMDIADIEVIRALNHIFAKQDGRTGSWLREQYAKHQVILNELGLNELKAIISANLNELVVGNYFIDNRCERIMTERYQSNILNYKAMSEPKKIQLANDNWIFDIQAQAILNKMTDVLRKVAI